MHRLARILPSAALAFVAAAAAPPALAAQQDCASLPEIGISTMPGTLTSSAQTFTALAGYSMQVDVGTQCVHVQFNAQFRSKTPKTVRLRLTLDGTPSGFPNVVTLTTSGTGYDERAVTFFVPALPAGTYQVGVEFASGDGTAVNVRNGLLRIQFDGT